MKKNIILIFNGKDNKLDYLNELISKLGGWPLLQGDKWNETNFDWIDFVHKAQENGVDYDVFIIKGLWHHGNFTQFLSVSNLNDYIFNESRCIFQYMGFHK